MRPVPYLLKLPAAAARLPDASLQAIQRSCRNDATVHWHRTALDNWVAERIDVDLEALGAVKRLPQQPPTLQHVSSAKGEMAKTGRHNALCTIPEGTAALWMATFCRIQGYRTCQRTCTCSSCCCSCTMTGGSPCLTQRCRCFNHAASCILAAVSSAARWYIASLSVF
jgi:hypothetical protein